MLLEHIKENTTYTLRMDILKNILKYMISGWIHLWGVQIFFMIFHLEQLKFLMHAKLREKMPGMGIEWTKVCAGIKKLEKLN